MSLSHLAYKFAAKYSIQVPPAEEHVLEDVKSIIHPMIFDLQKALKMLDRLPQEKIDQIERYVKFENLRVTNDTLWKLFHVANNLLLGAPLPEVK